MARRFTAGFCAEIRAARKIVRHSGTDWESALRCLKSAELRVRAGNAQPTKGVTA